jgi:hypothetical protein
MTADNVEDLRQLLLEVVVTHEARLQRQDEFGRAIYSGFFDRMAK